MSKTIEGVPASIARKDYIKLIESVGFDSDALISLSFNADDIRARVVELDAEGCTISSPTPDDEFAVVTHDICIPVADVK